MNVPVVLDTNALICLSQAAGNADSGERHLDCRRDDGGRRASRFHGRTFFKRAHAQLDEMRVNELCLLVVALASLPTEAALAAGGS